MATETLHIAIVPDGNRRWATKQAFKPWKGHEVAVENFRKLIDWCSNDPRVGILTLWCFSTENWKRDPKEIEMLMKMLKDYLEEERSSLVEKNTRFAHSGRKDRIPQDLATLIAEIEEETKDQTGNVLHLALDYGGRDEVTRAVQRMDDPSSATEESIREHLDHPELPDIDIIIRTSGEKRTSNFFLWQAAYAEWYFVDKLFPDFTTEDLATVVDDFTDHSRRFGA